MPLRWTPVPLPPPLGLLPLALLPLAPHWLFFLNKGFMFYLASSTPSPTVWTIAHLSIYHCNLGSWFYCFLLKGKLKPIKFKLIWLNLLNLSWLIWLKIDSKLVVPNQKWLGRKAYLQDPGYAEKYRVSKKAWVTWLARASSLVGCL